MDPIINEYELEQVVAILAIVNPGRSSAAFIRTCVADRWPFDNIATGGWVAYAEAPEHNSDVRIALTPHSVMAYLQAQGISPSPTEGMDQ